ncbi:alpha/beta hydrolase [Planotetraspora kaengkrachanensis]|nr:alpha/beta hydrolase [Planotetraspora kaengkrachanensis]
MSETGEVREAFRRASALVADHRADLDQAVHLMAVHAWVGGGAPRFAAELSRHRAILQSCLETALTEISRLVVRHGMLPPGMTSVHTSVTSMTATSSAFRGVDVETMNALVCSLERAAERMSDLSVRLHAELAVLCLPTDPGWDVAHSADWARGQARDLKRRLSWIQRAEPDAWTPWDGGVVSSGVVGFGFFEAFAPDPGMAAALLRRIAAGDHTALMAVVALQEQGQDPGLAARVHTWWRGLPRGLREELVSAAPQGVGALNGLPASVRDRANRLFLAMEKTRLRAESARLTREIAESGRATMFLPLDAALNALRRIDIIERMLTVGGAAGHPPLLLLSFNLTGLGRLVVSWGDPDTADTTVTYVPGLGTRLDTFDDGVERARRLWQQCQTTAGGRHVASIAWLGYDAPQLDPGIISFGRSVAMGGAADRGAGALAAFVDGLHAAHVPAPSARNVLLGHSYGSLVTGKAAVLRPGLLADDLIFVGSPGVGVEHAGDLGVAPGHVWVGEAGNDPVAYLGRFTADPGDASFGAKRFLVERSVITEAHSSYWNPYSSSLRNMGRIVNSQYGHLIKPEPLKQPQLLMPELAPPEVRELNR